ncbi:ExeM/NucH family extracellular endonuclease [Microbulbifer sp. OS29]|uniref:ExeM/NucH family extracellular endonuclease n=1 Tax=Microbulbifer okhotskensis TaxID=2926617 RepID=A0A9X2J6A8_9GAMM|nr:ExeM/NucH family extracellular endonuclease [Microbulbifer okhotskensis]MCO1335234.1 ExeM/NucH family extracellular endonuclease [Microbulbifer okhotskensis]
MKEIGLAALAALGLPFLAEEVQASDLVISEYIEGSSNNKALEIYNGTGAAVDLGNYSIELFFNGSSTAASTIVLGGSLADGAVYVFAHGSADTSILSVADRTYTSALFNGDDAVALSGPNGHIDVIGQIGADPGSQWGDSSLGTQNQTLVRDWSVTEGRTDGSSDFTPSAEWTSAGQDDFSNLGWHGEDGSGGGDDDIVLGECGDLSTLISQVQGSDFDSALAGERHEIEAVVVGSFQDVNSGLSGFFVQEEDSDQDGQINTSEGLFVHGKGFGVEVQPGDLVRVGGVVTEYYGFTELDEIDGVSICGDGYSVAAEEVSLPFASAEEQEQYEGMLVEFPQALMVNDHYNLGRYGEVTLANGRLYIPTHNNEPGVAAVAQEMANELNKVVLDDGSSVQNPEQVPYPVSGLSASNTLRSGDTVSGLRGVLGYSYGAYRVHPIEAPEFVSANLREGAPLLSGQGSLKIASFNVLNYFNGDGNGGGFPTSRGADTEEEFLRQRSKIISAILGLDADVIGLMEIENDGYGSDSAIQDLVNGLNAVTASEKYQLVNPDLTQLGTDEITVGMIYRSDRMMPVGGAVTTDSYPFDAGNRQPLLQAFRELASGEQMAVVVNHFKSKGSCPNDASLNDDQGDGQGCWNALRTEAADALVSWVDTDPTGAGIDRILVLGDLNSYARENPIATLKKEGYTDLLEVFGEGEAYSYVYSGQSGYLDHALASVMLAPLVTGVADWHINADEPRVLDYNTEHKTDEQQESFYSTDAFRASDHDPLVVELDLSADNIVPLAAFDWNVEGFKVDYIDSSADSDGTIVSWAWDFGDGAVSTEQYPSHRYDVAGSYSVILQVEDDRGAISAVEQIVQVEETVELHADFKVHSFLRWMWVEDRSSYDGEGRLSYEWGFGDGATHIGPWAVHRYSTGGSYEITLTLKDDVGNEDKAHRQIEVRKPFWL